MKLKTTETITIFRLQPNLGSPQTRPVAQTEQYNKEINNTPTIETYDKVSGPVGLYKTQTNQ